MKPQCTVRQVQAAYTGILGGLKRKGKQKLLSSSFNVYKATDPRSSMNFKYKKRKR